MHFETFDQSDEETWPDQQKDNNEDKHIDSDKSSRLIQTKLVGVDQISDAFQRHHQHGPDSSAWCSFATGSG